jgi:hypothetical protein
MSRNAKRIPVIVAIPKPEDQYTWAWIGWAAISAGGFAALQGYALRTGQHNRTLSVHTRKVLGIYPPKPWHAVGRAIIIGGMAGFATWFSHHIAFSPGDDPRSRTLQILSEVRNECG